VDPASAEHTLSWDGDRFRDIDGSNATLVRQLIRALAAMFAAYCGATVATDHLAGGLDGTARFLAGGGFFTVFGAVMIFVVSAHPIRKAITEQRRVIGRHEAILRARTERQQFVADLQDAFDMERHEEGALDVVGRALDLVWEGPGELLVSDSSRAHLHRGAATTRFSPPLCSVTSPWDCPAVRRGQTLRFASSEHLAACPRLRERVPCSAVCIPVTVLGTPMGVVHVTGAVGSLPSTEDVGSLEALASQAGSRLGVLRAISQSELQASTDPLTGQLNRRSLEHEMLRLKGERRPYALLLADLDHFKDLNDTYGHETGDRALRLFARVVRESVRGDDLVCRYGGEEFVVVFPDIDAVTAAMTVHRVRTNLAAATATGEVPPFTASFGLADSSHGTDTIDVIRAADVAMFQAKQGGRDRLVISAGEGGAPAQVAPVDAD